MGRISRRDGVNLGGRRMTGLAAEHDDLAVVEQAVTASGRKLVHCSKDRFEVTMRLRVS
jgi:hypothetical protein